MIYIYTDGACMRNPGPGGWAALVLSGDEYQVCSGSAADTTNNRMEQTAVIQGLQATPQTSHVTVFTDSQYVIGTMTRSWKRRVNSDLWDVLEALCSRRTVTWEWVRGHTGEPGNEFVDAQAKWEAGVRSTGPQISEYFSGIEEGMSSKKKSNPENPYRGLAHIDSQGRANMVDVGVKPETEREAVATGKILVNPNVIDLIRDGTLEKGDVLATARLAGIMGAKQASSLIPLCHPIPLNHVGVEFCLDADEGVIEICATAKAAARTGVEMEALTAVLTAALTIYDMIKSKDRGSRIDGVRLLSKKGGQSGDVVFE